MHLFSLYLVTYIAAISRKFTGQVTYYCKLLYFRSVPYIHVLYEDKYVCSKQLLYKIQFERNQLCISDMVITCDSHSRINMQTATSESLGILLVTDLQQFNYLTVYIQVHIRFDMRLF
jgi:hypothetical protein